MTVLGLPAAHTPIQTRFLAVVPWGRGITIPVELWPSGITKLERNRGRDGGGRRSIFMVTIMRKPCVIAACTVQSKEVGHERVLHKRSLFSPIA